MRDMDGAGLATAMLPPGGRDDPGFRIIIVGPKNGDPYIDNADAIEALGAQINANAGWDGTRIVDLASKNGTKTVPTSRFTHSSKISTRNRPYCSGLTERSVIFVPSSPDPLSAAALAEAEQRPPHSP